MYANVCVDRPTCIGIELILQFGSLEQRAVGLG